MRSFTVGLYCNDSSFIVVRCRARMFVQYSNPLYSSCRTVIHGLALRDKL